MIKKLIIIVLWCSVTTLYAQVPTNGLVAYYPFSGNAMDSSGNNNDGTVHGAEPTTDRWGRSDQAYEFNGSSDYILVPNSSSLQPADEFTLSAWVNITDLSTLHWILDKRINTGTAPYNSYILCSASNIFKTGITTNVSANAGKTTIVTGTWHHLVGVYDGSQLVLYLNGVTDDSVSVSGSVNYSTEPLYIGKSPTNSAFTKGKIDDIRIYNRALNAIEVASLYNETLTSSIKSISPIAEIHVFPNPATESVTIENLSLKSVELRITNPLGQILYSGSMAERITLELSKLGAKGIYLVAMFDDDGILVGRGKIVHH